MQFAYFIPPVMLRLCLSIPLGSVYKIISNQNNLSKTVFFELVRTFI